MLNCTACVDVIATPIIVICTEKFALNYRHSYHAGGSADVFKHYVLTLMLEALQQKPAPFCVMDSHAGAGAYLLTLPGDYEQGIGMLWPEKEKWPALSGYLAIIQGFNGEQLRHYPGSPCIIRAYLRAQDRAQLIELHPQDYRALKSSLSDAKGIAVHHGDARHLLKAFVPPKENRGLVLIDPPYEQADDFAQVVSLLKYCAKHWRNGSYMIWYPVKTRQPIRELHEAVTQLGLQAHAVEFTTLPTDVEQRLNGSGLILVNSPWKLLDTLRKTLPPLAEFLAGEQGKGQVRFIDLTTQTVAAGN